MKRLSFPWHLSLLPALLMFLPLLSPGVAAQEIRGSILEADNRTEIPEGEEPSPIAEAEVVLVAGGREVGRPVLSDAQGLFSLSVPRAGTYGLRITHPAYFPYETDGIRVGGDEAVVIEVRLGRNVIPLEPLVVTARLPSGISGFHERREGGGLGNFITREEIDTRSATRTTDLLRGVGGIRIDFQRWGVGSAIEMRNGFGSCEPTIYVDGVRSPQVQGSMLDDFITPERIEAVEVYSSLSTVPAQFINGMCGVILIWTRRGGMDEEAEPWQWRRILLGFGAALGLIFWVG